MMPTRDVMSALDQAFGAGETAAAEQRSTDGWSRLLWEQLDDNGFGAVLTASESGDPGVEDLWAVAESVGRRGAAIPIVEANVARFALAVADDPNVSAGVPTIVRLRRGALDQSGNGARVDGLVRDVPWGSLGGPVVLLHEAGENDLVGVVDSTLCHVVAVSSVADEPRAHITLPAQIVTMRSVEPRLGQLLSLAQTARILGGARAALSLTVRYSREREQFGRPIGRFQAISHQLAQLGGAVEMLGAMVERLAADVGTPYGPLAARAAKLCAADAIAQAVDVGHQVHGAIGVTTEYGLARHTGQLLAWSEELGSSREDAAALGRAAHGDGALWNLLSSGAVGG
jgi:acyl-CoA dehydrogenase